MMGLDMENMDCQQEMTLDFKNRLEVYLKKSITPRITLAQQIGINPTTLYRILRGDSVKPITLLKIGRFLESIKSEL